MQVFRWCRRGPERSAVALPQPSTPRPCRQTAGCCLSGSEARNNPPHTKSGSADERQHDSDPYSDQGGARRYFIYQRRVYVGAGPNHEPRRCQRYAKPGEALGYFHAKDTSMGMDGRGRECHWLAVSLVCGCREASRPSSALRALAGSASRRMHGGLMPASLFTKMQARGIVPGSTERCEPGGRPRRGSARKRRPRRE